MKIILSAQNEKNIKKQSFKNSRSGNIETCGVVLLRSIDAFRRETEYNYSQNGNSSQINRNNLMYATYYKCQYLLNNF